MTMRTITRTVTLNEAGTYDSWAWPGGYPMYYITGDCGVLCPQCANANHRLTLDPDDSQWYIIQADVNWEDESLFCDNCSQQIMSAYGEDKTDKGE